MQARELYQKTLDGYLHHLTKHWGTTLFTYCHDHHVNYRGMNLWMSRQGLCLRTLKSAVGATLKPSPLFAPLQSLPPAPSTPLEHPDMLYGIHITFPDGTVITIKQGTPQSVNTFIDYYNLKTPEPTPCFP